MASKPRLGSDRIPLRYSDGIIERGRDDSIQGAHAQDFNTYSLGIVLIGGTNDALVAYDDGYNKNQWVSLLSLLKKLTKIYKVSSDNVLQHRELPAVNKACASISTSNMNLIRNLL